MKAKTYHRQSFIENIGSNLKSLELCAEATL